MGFLLSSPRRNNIILAFGSFSYITQCSRQRRNLTIVKQVTSNTESITTHAKEFQGISTYVLKKTSFGLCETAADWRKFNFKETLSLRI